MKPNAVITRFPPSPTGYFHIGSARTALFNYLFAKHAGGKIFLRFEDTDTERSKKEFEDDILSGLDWLGLALDRGAFLRQSERTGVYRTHLTGLIEQGVAYEAEESTVSPGMKVVRFRNPKKTVTFHDVIRGDVSFDTAELGDFIIARTHDLPLYHLAVVVDDAETGVTHIIRGEDHISNTQRQILLIEAFGFARPQYAHIPLILAPDKAKLSKRHGAVSIHEYRAQGFIPEALINYLALLGWNPGLPAQAGGKERELYTLEELVGEFSLERVHKSGAVFDIEKLTWFNHEYLRRLPDAEFKKRLEEFAHITIDGRLVPLLKERSRTLKEAADALAAGEYRFLTVSVFPDKELLLKAAQADADAVKKHLKKVGELLAPLADGEFGAAAVRDAVFPYATQQGRAAVLWPLRVALSGAEKSPDPFTLAALLGKNTTLSRIGDALRVL